MPNRILITGCRGMLGSDLMTGLSPLGSLLGADIEDGDLSDPDVCRQVFEGAAPDVVVNAAAFTAVDLCEDPAVYPRALAANAVIPENMAGLCAKSGALLVHISTDYVYDGNKREPYVEGDAPAPLNAYGRTKLAGDEAVLGSSCRSLILRTAWLFGRHGRNFVEAILAQAETKSRLAVVDDQKGAPTWTRDLAEGVRIAIEKGLTGLYHFTSAGQTTWRAFACLICEMAGKQVAIDPIDSERLLLPARRPTNSVLDCSAFIRATGFYPRRWDQALEEYLRDAGRLARPR